MFLLRTLFGGLTSGIVRLAVAAGVLLLCYLFIVEPALKATDDAFHSTGLEQIGDSLEGAGKKIEHEVQRSFETAKRHGNPRKLVHCIKHASGDVKRIERCTRRF